MSAFLCGLPERAARFSAPLSAALLCGLLTGIPISVSAQAPAPAVPPAKATLHVSDVQQPIYGFGGTLTYSGDALATFKNRETAYRLLFQDLKLDILRLRNYNGYAGQQKHFEAVTREYARAARRWSSPKVRGDKGPVRLMFTSWSPPADLKSNGLTSGTSDGTAKGLPNATLKRGPDGRYVYGAFADWWLQSVQKFQQLCGAYPDYVAIQNELDFSAPYEACHFLPTEGTSPAGYPMAGYAQALSAVSQRLTGALGAQTPKLLGPETFSINTGPKDVNHVIEYVDPATATGQTELSELFGISFHLYGTGASGTDLDRFHRSLESLPAAYQANGVDKPLFETEYLKGSTMTALASMIHDTLVDGNVSAYLVWILARSTQSPGLAMVYFDPNTGLVTPRQRFYAVKAYSAFVGEGWHRIGADCSDPAVEISAFIGPADRQLVAVLVNPTDQPRRVTLTPDGTADDRDTSAVYQSSEGEDGERWQELGPLPTGNSVMLPPKSVSTVKWTRPAL